MNAAFDDVPRKRCGICGKLTKKWQSINGGPWHCYDQCRSTGHVNFYDRLLMKQLDELAASRSTRGRGS